MAGSKNSRAEKPMAKGGTPADIGPGHSGRQIQSGPPQGNQHGRGSSMQGEKQDARGGPAGANQGGAPRGSSRLEPSHNTKSRLSGKRH